MLPTHLEFLKNFDKLQRRFENAKMVSTRNNGEHWSTCCWSSDSNEEGPDTCSCVSLAHQRGEALTLIELYHYANIGRKKEKCCFID